MRTLALSLLLGLTIPIAVSTAYADPAEGAVVVHEPADLAIQVYHGIASGDWFLAAGAALCLVTLAVRSVLKKQWPALEGDLWGVALVAALAGLGALGNAWIADADIGARTLVGAVKVWGAAVFAYVTAKKILEARPRVSPPHSSSIQLLMVAVAVSTIACRTPGPGPVIGQTVIDCTGEHRAQIDALFVELSPLVFGDRPDWSAVYQRAKHAGVTIGGCVIAELVQVYMGGRRAVPNEDGWKAHTALEEFREAEAGGATFKTRFGNL